jgi:hypothetical protein
MHSFVHTYLCQSTIEDSLVPPVDNDTRMFNDKSHE